MLTARFSIQYPCKFDGKRLPTPNGCLTWHEPLDPMLLNPRAHFFNLPTELYAWRW